MSKITPIEIYDELVRLFPSNHPPLRKIPSPLPHPGNKPVQPREEIRKTITINNTMSFQEIATELKGLYRAEQVNAYFYNEKVGVVTLNDEYDGEFTINQYSENVERVTIDVTSKVPNYWRLVEEWQKEVKTWENKLNSYRERNNKIQDMKEFNNMLIHDARMNNPSLWKGIGRNLSGRPAQDIIKIERQALLEKLAKVDEILSILDEEEGDERNN